MADKAYKPLQTDVSIKSSTLPLKQAEYYPTEAEYSSKAPPRREIVWLSDHDTSSGANVIYTVPEKKILYVTMTSLSATRDESMASTGHNQIMLYRDATHILNCIHIAYVLGVDQPETYVSNLNYLLPIKFEEGETITMFHGTSQFYASYVLMGYLIDKEIS